MIYIRSFICTVFFIIVAKVIWLPLGLLITFISPTANDVLQGIFLVAASVIGFRFGENPPKFFLQKNKL